MKLKKLTALFLSVLMLLSVLPAALAGVAEWVRGKLG